MHHETSCPRCGAQAIITNNYARKVGALLGAIAGAITGLKGTKGCSSLTIIAGTLISVLLGATTGSSTGAIFGASIDDNVLNNFVCVHCNARFSQPQTEATRSYPPDHWH